MSRLDIMVARDWTASDGATKTNWTKIGVAFPAKQGNGYRLTFEALPLPALNREGKLECVALLREPLPPRDAGNGGSARAPARPASSYDLPDIDDDVPF